ncbi:MAG: OmpA family protein [Steroidobacter sp.]
MTWDLRSRKSRVWKLLCVGAAASIAHTAIAKEEDPIVEVPNISLLANYVDADEERNVDYGRGLKILVGWGITETLHLELNTSFTTFDTGVRGTDFYRTAGNVDAVYYFPVGDFAPFVLGGIGAAHNDVAEGQYDGVSFTAGVGLGLLSPPLTDYGIRIRGEVRRVYDDALGKPQDMHFSLGVLFPLRKPKYVEVVQTEVQEVVKEIYRDPPPPPAPPPVRDSDKDGVPDERDACPDTLSGATVDARGCVREQSVIQLSGVYFEYNSSRLTENSKSILQMGAASLRGQSDMRVEVAGHTDDRGNDAYNLNLSRQRAVAVVEYLTGAGIEADRVQARGYGETQPVADNDTEAGRERNRRVEFRVLPK